LIVAFDASTLIYLFDDQAAAPVDPGSGRPVERCRDRIEYLLDTLAKKKARIIIPTPSLAEALVRAQEGAPERLRILKSSKHFKIVPFDERAAVEYAATQTIRHMAGTKSPSATRQKAKFDDQIAAIAAVEGATELYSDDDDIAKLVGSRMKVIGIVDLPLPPEDAQGDMFSQLPDEMHEDADLPERD
jgi:predicted nucleic acid-binding protein